MISSKNLGIRTKLFLSIGVLVLLLLVIFTVFSLKQTKDTLEENENESFTTMENVINSSMQNQLDGAKTSVLAIANNQEVARLFAERDRQGLLDMLLPAYKAVADVVPQFQFHLPDSTSFLRLHKPDEYGDDLSSFRFTVNEANEKKKLVMGLEEGKGGYGFRVVAPMFYNGKHTGSVEFAGNFDATFLKKLKESYSGEYFIYSFGETEPTLLAGTAEDKWMIEQDKQAELKKGSNITLRTEDEKYGMELVPFKDYSGKVKGYVKYVRDRQGTLTDIRKMTYFMYGASVIGALLIAILLFLLLTVLLKPLDKLVKLTEQVANGDLTVAVDTGSNDEIGRLKSAFKIMVENLRNLVGKVQESVSETSTSTIELSANVEEVTAQQEQISSEVSDIAAAMEEMSASVEEMTATTNEISNDASLLGSKAESGREKVLEIEERAKMIKQTAKNSKTAAVNIYKDKHAEIKQAMEQAKIVNEIAEMAEVISNIAGQTNLLSLNAAIEAARAGVEGRGFAVVAEEVKHLAQYSDETASQIKEVIGKVQDAVEALTTNSQDVLSFIENTVTPDYDMLEKTGMQYSADADFVKEIVDEFAAKAQFFARSINEVNTAVNEIAAGVEEATVTAQQISENTKETTKALEDVAKTTEEQAGMAERLSRLVGEFKVQ